MKARLLACAIAAIVAVGSPIVSGIDDSGEQSAHPHISRAIEELHAAISDMERSPDDFGGHRERAIAASREAIEQLQRALEYRSELRLQ